jgi:hypothetical protein
VRETVAGNGRASIIVDHVIAACPEVISRCTQSVVAGSGGRARHVGDILQSARRKRRRFAPRRKLR